MTVFLAHAPADRAAAQALERVIERRGQFVELDDGQTALRPVQESDALVLLISSALAVAVARLRLEQRALDAWAAGRLVVVKLDQSLPPVGLRDLPAIDATREPQRELKWNEAADAVREKLKPARVGSSPIPDERRPDAPRRKSSVIWPAFFLLAAIPGLIAFAASMSIWLVNRIGPTPGGWPEFVSGVEAFGARYGLPAALTPWLFALAIVVTIAVGVFGAAELLSRGKSGRTRFSGAGDAVFVSYARANTNAVLPMIETARRAGHEFWVDRKGVAPGDGWAGEIVRAIRGAAGVLVMCSKAAFESDHVKREIYLADRYRKRLVPVFIEHAEPPEDFQYFFAGAPSLNLFETPEAERPQALLRILGAAS